MTLRDIVVAFGYEVDTASENKANNSIKGVSNLAKKLLGSIAVYFSIQGLSSLAQAAADVEALNSQFTQVFGDMQDEATSSLQAIADEAGAMTNRMKGSFTQIAAFTKTTGATEAEALGIAERGMKAVADSAAFYDRSLEDLTASLQSFLKGNYEQDAALGVSATETTRNAAANELYGKSFKDLSEYQKQLTLLKMVEDANKMSGALGQAARESDTWTNRLGNLKQSVTDLKATAGSTFLKPAIAVLKILTSLVQKATNGVKSLTAENGLLTRATERYHALVKRLQPAITRMAQALTKGMTKGREVIQEVVGELGGTHNAIKILSITAAAFFMVFNWSKIITGAKTFSKLFSSIKKIFSVATIKAMALVAVIVLIALVIEDFIHFLLGNESVMGGIFDEAGIGADNARQKIFDAWTKVKEFLTETWEFIKEAASMFIGAVKDFFSRHTESIRSNFERAWNIIKDLLSGIWTFISQLADTIFGGTEESIDGSQQSTKDKMLAIWQNILETLSAVWDALYEAANTVFNALATVVEVIFGWVKEFWNEWGTEILAWFKVLWDSLGGMLHGFLEVVKGIANFISAVFTGDWAGAWEAIKQIFVGVWEMLKNYIVVVWEKIKLTFAMAWEAIKAVFSGVGDFFKGVWDKVVAVFTSIGTAISDAISGAVKKAINSVLGTAASIINGFITAINTAISVINAIPGVEISKLEKLDVPELAEGGIATRATTAIIGEGAEDEAIMPLSKLGGMISGYVKEAKESTAGQMLSSLVKDAVNVLSTGVSAFTRAATASSATALNSTTNNSNSNVVQNVEISNSYSGGDMETQKNVSKAMKKSAVDATTQMARALAYTRG